MFKHFLKLGTGSVLAQILTFCATPLITRIYSPAEYGVLAIFLALGTALAGATTMRYELAIVLPKQKSKASCTAVLAMSVCLFSSALFATIIFFAQDLWASFELGKPGAWSILSFGYLVSFGYQQICLQWATRLQKFGTIATAGMVQAAATVTSQILMGYLNYEAYGLALGYVIGQSAAAAVMFLSFRTEFVQWEKIRFSRLRVTALRYIKYPKYMSWFPAIVTVRDRAVLFFLQSLGATTAIGFYAFAYRIVHFPATFMSGAMRPVFFQFASTHSPENIEKRTNQILKSLIALSVPFLSLFICRADEIFGALFGEQWRGAGTYGALLSLVAFTCILSGWLDRMYDVLGKQQFPAIIESIFAALSISVVGLGTFLLSSIEWAVGMNIAVQALYHLTWLGCVYRLAGFNLARLAKIGLFGVSYLAINLGCTYVLSRSLPGPSYYVVTLALSLTLISISFRKTILRMTHQFGSTHSAS